MVVRFKKFKKTKEERIQIAYEKQNSVTQRWDEFTMSCSEKPRPELIETLNKLAPHVIEMCELPKEYEARIEVTGVTFSYGGELEVMGATITSQMALKYSNCDLNLNTPHKASGPYNDYEIDDELLLSSECVDALDALCIELRMYVEGHRAQQTLFAV